MAALHAHAVLDDPGNHSTMIAHRLLAFTLWGALAVVSAIGLALSAAYLYLDPQVPDAAEFREVKLRAPLRIYSSDDRLMQEFGERLTPVTYDEIPKAFEAALLNTEDKRFFEHRGVDLITLFNASWQLIRNRGAVVGGGASTITMQLVKNISGSTEVRFIRKFREMLLALKIEREFTKEEILALYLNVIPFGKHAFGIQAAANTYYGRNIDELDLAQTAMLAGILKRPEAGNPINGPEWALERRNLVLRRMQEQDSITRAEYEQAVAAPITAEVHSRPIELPALYVSEMVRQHLLDTYGSGVYNEGLVVHTTLDSKTQSAAERALRIKLLEYDRRHGYRGPEFRKLDGTSEYLAAPEYGYPANWLQTLAGTRVIGGQHPAIVTAVEDDRIEVLLADETTTHVLFDDMKWARPYLTVNRRGGRPREPGEVVAVGDLIRLDTGADGQPVLGQVPAIQGAVVALDPADGAVRALVGGFDFTLRQFNHATQARRQPGSNFKPFFYAGAIEGGLTASTIYNDAPVVMAGGDLEEIYRPRNSGDGFRGNITLREALYRSINLVSLRVILDYGPANAIEYVKRFGFDTSDFPHNVQLAFGGGTIALTPIEVATGYTAFANGGFKVTPYFIKDISSINHHIEFTMSPARACDPCAEDVTPAPRIVEPRVSYIMDSILADVMKRGTGTKAYRALERDDLRGKTGTTNDADIWFSGYNRDLVASVWVGFGDNSPVGNREWGSTAPLETWVELMKEALPPPGTSAPMPPPDGLVTVKIDPASGLRTLPTDPDGVFEIFREEYAPALDTTVARQLDEKTDEPVQIF